MLLRPDFRLEWFVGELNGAGRGRGVTMGQMLHNLSLSPGILPIQHGPLAAKLSLDGA